MTPNEIIGSLVYRTCAALNGNASFMNAVKRYCYSPAVVVDDVFHLWHFPGTAQEISHVFQALSKDTAIGSMLKFPAILNFQSVIEEHNAQQGLTVLRYNLAIVTPVLSEWTTQQREEQAYKLVLRPIEREFIRQIKILESFFEISIDDYSYSSVYVPTTGESINSVMKILYLPTSGKSLNAAIKIMYGDFLDAVELPNLVIKVPETCEAMSGIIEKESKKVTDEIINIKKRV